MNKHVANLKPGKELDYTQYLGCNTVAKLFRHQCKHYGSRTAHREKDLGIWQSYTWDQYYKYVQQIAHAMRELGIKRGDAISILSEDNKEWLYFDMAAACTGIIPSGVYTTDSAKQLAFLVNDSNSTLLIVENDEQLDKYLEIRDDVPSLKKVVVLDSDGLRDFEDDVVIVLDDLYVMGEEAQKKSAGWFDEEIDKCQPDDVRMLIYTSGTTGKPKGAMITHANIIFQLVSLFQVIDCREADDQLCFLPLCHILERLFTVECQLAKGYAINFAESPETVFENVQELSPHQFAAVPRVWEKMFSRVEIMRKEATPFGRWAFDQALTAGKARAGYLLEGKDVPASVQMRYKVWDALVLGNLRRMLGMDRLRRGGTGAAPISPEIISWFWAIGVPLYEGFGQTESTGVATLNHEHACKLGTIGATIPGTETKIGPDNEILLKGPHVFKGYWKQPEKTAETFTKDGWLRTGDVGHVDNQGFFTITGRIKDIIITAGGKNITPAELESALKFSSYISDAVVIGDKRKYLTCLIMIDQENVEKFAQDNRVPFSNFASLCAAPEVVDLIGMEVDKVNKNFARVEQIKEFRLIDVLLTAEDDELTPTMKLKRSFVESKHKGLIDSMY